MRLVYFSKTFNLKESSAWNFIMLLSAEYATGGPSTLSTVQALCPDAFKLCYTKAIQNKSLI